MIKGLDEVLRKLNNLANSQIAIRKLFFEKTSDWIIKEANAILISRLNNIENTFNSHVTESWEKEITDDRVVITNTYDNSASIEFGIGVVGQTHPHDEANNAGYIYNVASPSKDDLGRWTFKEPVTQQWYFKYSGYEGKSFLYDALVEYYFQNMWGKLYEQAFAEIFKKL